MKRRKDQDFLNWIETLPSVLDGNYSQYLENGDRLNIACHVRRAGKAGTGYKPLYCAVPMTQAQHLLQSNQGELAVIMAYVKSWSAVLEQFPGETLVHKAKAFFDFHADNYAERFRKLYA